jgi:hypothetical protein
LHVAISKGATLPDTTATPIEVTFSGGSGFNVTTPSTDIVSDWMPLGALSWVNGDTLETIIDLNSAVGWGLRQEWNSDRG